jgi:hypothetical protein
MKIIDRTKDPENPQTVCGVCLTPSDNVICIAVGKDEQIRNLKLCAVCADTLNELAKNL